MNSAEAVAQQIFGIKSFDLLQFFGKVALRRIVTENVPHCDPDSSAGIEYTTLEPMKCTQELIRV